jgi:hypothetical protein
VLTAALTESKDQATAEAAAWFLRKLAVGPQEAIRARGAQLARALRRGGVEHSVFPPIRLFHIHSGNAEDDLLAEYLLVVRHSDRAGPVPTKVITELVRGRSRVLHAFAFSELNRRHARPPVKALQEQLRLAGTSEDRPEVIVRRIAFEANYGSLDEARRLVLVMCDLQAQRHRGASLRTAHRALTALAYRETGPRGDMFGLAGSLVSTRYLDSAPEVSLRVR